MTDRDISRGERRGSRLPARARIVGWIVLTAALGLLALIVTVHSALQAGVARQANAQVEQELAEFDAFVSEGRDPRTGRAFGDVRDVFDVYLRRQEPEPSELLLARADGSQDVLSTSGGRQGSYDLAADHAVLSRVLAEAGGIAVTPAGEIRWGHRRVDAGDGPDGTIALVVFTEPMAAEAGATTRLMAGVSAGSLILIAAMAFVAAGQILRPLREVQRTAEAITQEDLARRIPITGRDDVAELAVQFNAMLDRLQEAFVGEQRFVDDAGRHLGEPIASLRRRLTDLPEDPERRNAELAATLQDLDRMARIVSDLLILATVERPDTLTLRRLDAMAFTQSLEDPMRELGDRRWIVRHDARGECEVDPGLLTEAVLALVRNAVQHTEPGGTIEVTDAFVETPDGTPSLQFRVTDDGPGVRPEEAEQIFERFGRGESGERRGRAGLGLAMVRAVADAHGGYAAVESRVGQGATFSLTVPAGAVGTSSAPRPVHREEVLQ